MRDVRKLAGKRSTLTTARARSPAIIAFSLTSSKASWTFPSGSIWEMRIRFTSCIRSPAWGAPKPSAIMSSSKLNHKPGYRSSSPGYVGPNALLTPTRRNTSFAEESTTLLYWITTGGWGSRSLRMHIVCNRCCLPENKRSRWGRMWTMIGVVAELSGSYLMSIWGYICGLRRRVSSRFQRDVPNANNDWARVKYERLTQYPVQIYRTHDRGEYRSPVKKNTYDNWESNAYTIDVSASKCGHCGSQAWPTVYVIRVDVLWRVHDIRVRVCHIPINILRWRTLVKELSLKRVVIIQNTSQLLTF